jgi:hypothetical protein
MSLWDAMGLANKRVLILHHDDLGITHAQNQAYLSLKRPSGSVMAPSAWATGLVGIAGADLGVHVTLTSEWAAPRLRPISTAPSLRDSAGFFWPTLNQAWGHIDANEAAIEIGAQIEAVRRMGIEPTHLDAHMGVVFRPDIAARFIALATELGMPVAAASNLDELPVPEEFKSLLTDMRERADLPRIEIIDSYEAPTTSRREWYVDRLSRLGPGVYHVLHHAQKDTEEGRQLGDWEKRLADFQALSDPAVMTVLDEFVPLTYAEIGYAMRHYGEG